MSAATASTTANYTANKTIIKLAHHYHSLKIAIRWAALKIGSILYPFFNVWILFYQCTYINVKLSFKYTSMNKLISNHIRERKVRRNTVCI